MDLVMKQYYDNKTVAEAKISAAFASSTPISGSLHS